MAELLPMMQLLNPAVLTDTNKQQHLFRKFDSDGSNKMSLHQFTSSSFWRRKLGPECKEKKREKALHQVCLLCGCNYSICLKVPGRPNALHSSGLELMHLIWPDYLSIPQVPFLGC